MRRNSMKLSKVNKIGIVGGGPSALVLCFEAAKLGISTCLLDPKVNCIGASVATEHFVAAINKENVKKLSLRCDKVIFNIKPEFVMDVKLHAPIYPNKEALGEVCSVKNMLELLEILEIPSAKFYYQDNKQDAFKKVEGITLPFRFIKQYKGYSKQMDIFSQEDLADFILEVDEDADSFILQTIEDYKQTISCICLGDQAGKVYLYDPIEINYDDEEVCHIKIADTLTKNMISRLNRYNRKIMKEIKPVGVFTIRYGIKANKSLEFIDMTPELGVGSLLTMDAYEISVFEQYLRLALDMKLESPELQAYVHGTIKESAELEQNDKGHLFMLEGHKMCIRMDKNTGEDL